MSASWSRDSLSSIRNWMWCVVMEMYLFDRLAISLERLYTAVPTILLNLYEVTREASSLSCIFGQELYKCGLLIIGVIRVIFRILAYFFHFDPPTFDALQEMTRIYLDPDAESHHKERLVLERMIAELKADNAMLLKHNEEMSARICLLETHARGTEVSLSQHEDMARQLLLGILACRQSARSFVPILQSSRVRLGVPPKLLGSNRFAKEDSDEIWTQDNVTPQLLVQLLTFRRSTRCTTNAITSMTSANGHLKEAVRRCEDISQSFLIELLTIRKDARALCAQKRIKSRLAIVLARKQQQGMQNKEAEYETANKHILIQTLTLRSRLSHLLLSRKSASFSPEPPLLPVTLMTPSPSFQSLTTRLEALRLSEAQAHAEKDSLAKSLSDVLANLPLPNLCANVMEEGPIRELVLALAFTWKLVRRKQPLAMAKFEEVKTDKVYGETDLNLRGEQKRTLRPGIPFDSVRARAFKLGPPMNKSIIPTQDASRHRPIHEAHTSINFDPQLGRGLTHVNDSQPQFPPGIPLPPHLGRSPALPSNHLHVFGRPVASSYPNPIHPPRSTIMSRGGYIFERPNEASFHPDSQVRHESTIGYSGFPHPIGSSAHDMDVALSVTQYVPPRPFSAT